MKHNRITNFHFFRNCPAGHRRWSLRAKRSKLQLKIKSIQRVCFASVTIAGFILLFVSTVHGQTKFIWSHGGIIRGDQTEKKIALIFSADIDAEGLGFIDSTFHAMDVKGSFFFTGNFFKRKDNRKNLKKLLLHGNYVSSHSYGHLLYCDWTKRDSLLVSKEIFEKDMSKSFAMLGKYGIRKQDAKYFLPPYEWYNDSIAAWAKKYGLQIVNFTPGTYSNADYTTPDMGKKYLSSDTIYNRIIRYEKNGPNGLNGFFLLIHAGTAPARTDKLYYRLPDLIRYLRDKGYVLVRIDELLKD